MRLIGNHRQSTLLEMYISSNQSLVHLLYLRKLCTERSAQAPIWPWVWPQYQLILTTQESTSMDKTRTCPFWIILNANKLEASLTPTNMYQIRTCLKVMGFNLERIPARFDRSGSTLSPYLSSTVRIKTATLLAPEAASHHPQISIRSLLNNDGPGDS